MTWVLGHEGHDIDPPDEHGKTYCRTCKEVVDVNEHATAHVEPTADGDGDDGFDIPIYIPIK